MKKANTFLKFLEKVHPLEAKVYFSDEYDMAIYKTSHSFEDRERLMKGHPLGDLGNRDKFYESCIKHIIVNEPKEIQEFLFYSRGFEQGMVMAYRPDSLRKGLWCLVIITILPYQRHAVSPKHPTKKVIVEKMIAASEMPQEALNYIMEVAGKDRLQTVIDEINSMEFDATSFVGSNGIRITLEKDGIKSISSVLTHRNIKLVEV